MWIYSRNLDQWFLECSPARKVLITQGFYLEVKLDQYSMSGAVLLLFLFLSSTISAALELRLNYIRVGSSLTPTADPVWPSPSGNFAFGFYQKPDGFAVCIFFQGLSERTVVWTANRDNPFVPNNSVLQLTQNGLFLQLKDQESSRIDRSSQPVGWAAMHDNGNFVLYNRHGRVAWQSFDHPTDSLLPGQRLTPGNQLISWASKSDPKKGLFRLKMQTDGNLAMYGIDTLDSAQDAYYATGTNGEGHNVSLNLGNDGHLYLFNGSSVLLNLTSGGYPAAGTLYLMRIDADGIFRLYQSSHGGGNWTSIWAPFDDKCLPKGVCGINSCCIYNINHPVECKCLPGFDFIIPGEPSAGCTSNITVDCSDKDEGGKFLMKRMKNIVWEDNYYSVLSGTNQKGCAEACLKDCSCSVAFFSDGQCRKQKLPLRYGRWVSPILSDEKAFVRVAKETQGIENWNPALPKNGHRKLWELVILGGLAVVFGLLIASIIIYYTTTQCGWCNQREENENEVDKFLHKHGSLALKRYSCNEIKKMTKCFADKLGEGGYGIVYRGKLPDGRLVAVKVLTETHDNAEEFINEVASISRTSHVNIVNLLGFCYHGNKRALVYEFMPNKSLDKFISKSRDCSLEWKQLYEIAVGVARGLEYLHRGCNTRIVHFDIKPQNILLDEEFCPKISDFGLAKLCKKKQSVISMLGTRGTVGYIAPEVFSRSFGVVSHRSDVYSYGIMVLHMAEAKNGEMEWGENSFLDGIYEQVVVQNERMNDVMSEEEEESGRKMIMVGFWCIQTSPADRPTMSKVVEMLEGKLEFIQIPPKPFLLSSPKPHFPYSISSSSNCDFSIRCRNSSETI